MFYDKINGKQDSRRGQVQSNQHTCDEVLYEEINTLKDEIKAIKESMFIFMSLLPKEKQLQLLNHIGQESNYERATNENVVSSNIESHETSHCPKKKKVNSKRF